MKITSVVEDVAVNLLRLAAIRLPADVKEALEKAHRQERSRRGRIQLSAILENIKLAEEEG
ncbi:MAG: fumarate hydratase, partial [Candidatus Bathyarchaeia archaeon]